MAELLPLKVYPFTLKGGLHNDSFTVVILRDLFICFHCLNRNKKKNLLQSWTYL